MLDEMTDALPRRLIVMALELEGQGVFERRGIPVLIWNVVGLAIYLLWARRKSLLEPAASST